MESVDWLHEGERRVRELLRGEHDARPGVAGGRARDMGPRREAEPDKRRLLEAAITME